MDNKTGQGKSLNQTARSYYVVTFSSEYNHNIYDTVLALAMAVAKRVYGVDAHVIVQTDSKGQTKKEIVIGPNVDLDMALAAEGKNREENIFEFSRNGSPTTYEIRVPDTNSGLVDKAEVIGESFQNGTAPLYNTLERVPQALQKPLEKVLNGYNRFQVRLAKL